MRNAKEISLFLAAAGLVLVVAFLFILAASRAALAQEVGWWETDDDIKDWELVDHLRDPDALGRTHAAAMLSQRWTGPQYVKLLKDDWQAGMESLNGYWPAKDGEPLAVYLLSVDRPKEHERLAAAGALASNIDGDRIAMYKGPIRDEALRLWCEEWMANCTQVLADPTPIWYAGAKSRSWLRAFIYADGDWTEGWRSSWRLREFRLSVACFAGDAVDDKDIERSEFIAALHSACTTGKNPCDKPLDDSAVAESRLVSIVEYDGFGGVTYAELVCLICDRPDWMAKTHERLKAAKRTYTLPIVKPDGSQAFGKQVIAEDCRTDYVVALTAIKDGKLDDAMTMFGGLFRREWKHWEWSWAAGAGGFFGPNRSEFYDYADIRYLPRHPWAQNAVQSSEFRKKFDEEWMALEWGVEDVK